MSDSPEHLANLFLGVLLRHQDQKHVFRVASWIGMFALAIDKVKVDWHRGYKRHLTFHAPDRCSVSVTKLNRYKVRYSHSIKPRGGLEIVEIGTSRGQPELDVVAQFACLADVERFYQLCSQGWQLPMVLAAYHGSKARRAAQAQLVMNP
jgi:hypothetical protein